MYPLTGVPAGGGTHPQSSDAWRPQGIDNLEPAAWDALRATGSTAVSAGPGAGKTELLAQRAAYLLQTGACPAPQRILAISYKRSAASNLARRIETRIPEHAQRFVSMTFDSFTKGLVDRFSRMLPGPWERKDAPYEIQVWSRRDVEDFLSTLAATAPASLRHGLFALPAGRFLSDVVGAWPLPEDPGTAPSEVAEFAAWSWWKEQYLRPAEPEVEFTMLNRLADRIVRSSMQLANALRATYPFVFVDEFQDTNKAQFNFLKTIFDDPGVTLTAVGDTNQRVMKFAGALDDAMGQYERDFNARRYTLTWNFRSSDDLVSFQRRVLDQLEPGAAANVSKASAEAGHTPVSLWTYPNAALHARHIAQWIAQDIAASGRTASDFALVAKQKVADFEPDLASALREHSIGLRNDDARYGKLRLQDLLKHDLTRLVLGVLRLSATAHGLPVTWMDTFGLLSRVRAGTHDETAARQTSDNLSQFVAGLREWLRHNAVGAAAPGEVIERAAAIVDTEDLVGFIRGQRTGDDVAQVLEALAERLGEAMTHSNDWAQVFADVAAEDAVTLMTIHRSKSLEYHTVFVLALDDDQWWSFLKDVQEGTSIFFVGVSRAAHRVVFTRIAGAENRKISALYQLLGEAGVKATRWSEATS